MFAATSSGFSVDGSQDHWFRGWSSTSAEFRIETRSDQALNVNEISLIS